MGKISSQSGFESPSNQDLEVSLSSPFSLFVSLKNKWRLTFSFLTRRPKERNYLCGCRLLLFRLRNPQVLFIWVGPQMGWPTQQSPPPAHLGGSTKPASCLQNKSFSLGNALVNMSAPLSSVCTFSSVNYFPNPMIPHINVF